MRKSELRLAVLGDAASVNIQLWCEGLRHAGAEVHLLSFSADQANSSRAYRLSIPHLPGKIHYIAAVPYVRRLIRRIKPDIVLGYYVTGYGTLATLAGHHPLVQVTAGSDVLMAPSNSIMRRLMCFTLARANLVLALAPHLAEAAKQLGVAQDRILVLPHGIPFQRFAGKRSSPPSCNDLPYIISTRSLRADYNISTLMEAIGLLRDSGINSFLKVAGDGPQRKELVTLAQKLGLEAQVDFVGFLPNDELPPLLAEHNLYVSLIGWDGVSASLLEAMAVGLFPIVPDNDANRFWISPGRNGLLLDDLSPVGVAEAIRKAIFDVPLRQRAWQQNPEIIRNRADLYHNSSIFIQHVRQVAANYRT